MIWPSWIAFLVFFNDKFLSLLDLFNFVIDCLPQYISCILGWLFFLIYIILLLIKKERVEGGGSDSGTIFELLLTCLFLCCDNIYLLLGVKRTQLKKVLKCGEKLFGSFSAWTIFLEVGHLSNAKVTSLNYYL